MRQEMRLWPKCGVGCVRALKGYGGQRTPGPQMCDAALCPPLPITVVGTLPLRQLQQRTSKSLEGMGGSQPSPTFLLVTSISRISVSPGRADEGRGPRTLAQSSSGPEGCHPSPSATPTPIPEACRPRPAHGETAGAALACCFWRESPPGWTHPGREAGRGMRSTWSGAPSHLPGSCGTRAGASGIQPAERGSVSSGLGGRMAGRPAG